MLPGARASSLASALVLHRPTDILTFPLSHRQTLAQAYSFRIHLRYASPTMSRVSLPLLMLLPKAPAPGAQLAPSIFAFVTPLPRTPARSCAVPIGPQVRTRLGTPWQAVVRTLAAETVLPLGHFASAAGLRRPVAGHSRRWPLPPSLRQPSRAAEAQPLDPGDRRQAALADSLGPAGLGGP